VAVGVASGGWNHAGTGTATDGEVLIPLRQRGKSAEVATVAKVAVSCSVNLMRSGLDCLASTTRPMSWPEETAGI
jgi:hypothetical protein